MPFKIVYTKLWGSPRPIAKKTDLLSAHSGALVATFVNNLVYTYKCDNYLESARLICLKTCQSRGLSLVYMACKFQGH